MQDFLTIREVAKHFGVSVQTVRRWVDGRYFPPPLRLGRRSIRWRRELVESYVLEGEEQAIQNQEREGATR